MRLADGHRNLVFNLLRTPAVNQEILRSVPRDAAAFVVGALNEAPSRFRETGAQADAQVVTALDFGREVFANITSFAVSVLTPDENAAASGVPMPDVAAVLEVNDPSKSQALWTQVLGLASMASGVGMPEGDTESIDGVTVHRYELPDRVTLFFATVGHDVFVASSRSAMSRSIQAVQAGRSVLDDPTFARRLAQLGPATTKAILAHPGRCTKVARPFMSPADLAEIEPVIGMMNEMVVSTVISHSDQELRLSTTVSGLPDVGEFVAAKLQEEEARKEAHVHLNKATRTGRWQDALEAVDGLLAKRPDGADLLKKKFKILAVGLKDHDAAQACGEKFYKAVHHNAVELNNFAWALLTEDQYGGQFHELALQCSARSNDLTHHKNWRFVDTFARAKFHTGDIEGGIKLQKKALELSKGAGAGEMEEALAKMEQALQQKGAVTQSG
jgi:hypothetical protein